MANNAESKGQQANQPGTKSRGRRAYHKKTRTGCKTCKIRRVRCDEEKPRCKRCVSTGRTCDGYDTTAIVPLPQATWPAALTASPDLALVRSGRRPEELRSYHFYIDVAAPSLGGAMNTDFWKQELPRVCIYDEAVWHAIVSLGSAYESYVSGVPANKVDNLFTLKHYNLAIESLTSSYHLHDWLRALTLSTVFSTICILESRFDESRLHFKAGYNLIREFDTPRSPHIEPPQGQNSQNGQKVKRLPSTFPVLPSSLRAVMIELEMRDNQCDTNKVSQLPSLLSQKDNFGSWRLYTSPRSLTSKLGEYLPEADLHEAIKNGESLFIGLMFWSMQHGHKLKQYYSEGRLHMLGAPGPTQEPHHRCFRELDKTITLFAEKFGDDGEDKKGWQKGDAQLRQAFLSLCLLQATNRFMLRRDPYESDVKKHMASLPEQCEAILDLAETLMSLERKCGCIRSGGPISSPTIMFPLIIVAKSGVRLAIRQRAVALLSQPRLESTWDCLMAASISKAIMAREAAATKVYNEMGLERTWIDNYAARDWGTDEDVPEENIHPMARIFNSDLPFMEGRKAKLRLRTWHEWLQGYEGQEHWIYW